MEAKRYQTLAEVPEWGKQAITKLIEKGCFADLQRLDLTEELIRGFVINDRAGVYL